MFYINKQYRSTDRFDQAKISAYEVDIYDTLQSSMLYAIPNIKEAGSFTVGDTHGRPDLASYRIYGTPSLWWVLLSYNGVFRPSGFTSDLTIKYPSLNDLESLRLALPAQQGAR